MFDSLEAQARRAAEAGDAAALQGYLQTAVKFLGEDAVVDLVRPWVGGETEAAREAISLVMAAGDEHAAPGLTEDDRAPDAPARTEPDLFDLLILRLACAHGMAQRQRARKQGQAPDGAPLSWKERAYLKWLSWLGYGERYYRHQAQDAVKQFREVYLAAQQKLEKQDGSAEGGVAIEASRFAGHSEGLVKKADTQGEPSGAHDDASSLQTSLLTDSDRDSMSEDDQSGKMFTRERLAEVAESWQALFPAEELSRQAGTSVKQIAPRAPADEARRWLQPQLPGGDVVAAATDVGEHMGDEASLEEEVAGSDGEISDSGETGPRLDPRLGAWKRGGALDLEQSFEYRVEQQAETQQEAVQDVTELFEQAAEFTSERLLTDQSTTQDCEGVTQSLACATSEEGLGFHWQDSLINHFRPRYKAAEVWLDRLRRALSSEQAWTNPGEYPGGGLPLRVSEDAANVLANCRDVLDLGQRPGDIPGNLPLGFYIAEGSYIVQGYVPARGEERPCLELRFSQALREDQLTHDRYARSRQDLWRQVEAIPESERVSIVEAAQRKDAVIQDYYKKLQDAGRSTWDRKPLIPGPQKVWQKNAHDHGSQGYYRSVQGRPAWRAGDIGKVRDADKGLALLERENPRRSFIKEGHRGFMQRLFGFAGKKDTNTGSGRSLYQELWQLAYVLRYGGHRAEVPSHDLGRAEEVFTMVLEVVEVQFARLCEYLQIDPNADEETNAPKYRTALTKLVWLTRAIRDRVSCGRLLSQEFSQYIKQISHLPVEEFSILCATLNESMNSGFNEERAGTREESRFFESLESFFVYRQAAKRSGLDIGHFHEDAENLGGAYSLRDMSAALECCELARDVTQQDHFRAMPPFGHARRLLRSGYRFVHKDMVYLLPKDLRRSREGVRFERESLESWVSYFRPPEELQQQLYPSPAQDEETGEPIERQERFDRLAGQGPDGRDRFVSPEIFNKPVAMGEERALRAVYLRFVAYHTEVSLTDALAYWDEQLRLRNKAQDTFYRHHDLMPPEQWQKICRTLCGWHQEAEARIWQGDQEQAAPVADDLAGLSSVQIQVDKDYPQPHIDGLLPGLELEADVEQEIREQLSRLNEFAVTYSAMSADEFSQRFRGIREVGSVEEKLAILREAMFRLSREDRVWLRLEQCVSILLGCRGHLLLQMETGEGKTKVIQSIALLQALAGKKVDVLTHNAELAEEGASGIQKLAGALGLTVADREQGVAGEDVDIFYTDTSRAVTDDLMARHGGQRVRQAEVVLMDEVDNIQVDVAAKTTIKLSVAERVDEVSAGEGKLSAAEQMALDFEAFLCRLNHWVVNPGDDLPAAKDAQLAALRAHLEAEEDAYYASLKDDEQNSQLREWLESAVSSLDARRDVDYRIVRDDSDGYTYVRIVHRETTGRTDKKSHWSEGVHQLVVARERERLRVAETEESDLPVLPPLTETVLEGHVTSYMERYAHRVGMTGTFGDEQTTARLERVILGEEGEGATVRLPRARREVDPDGVMDFETERLEDGSELLPDPSVDLGAASWPLETKLSGEALLHDQPQPMGFWRHCAYRVATFFRSMWSDDPAQPLTAEEGEQARGERLDRLRGTVKVRHNRRYDFMPQFFATPEDHQKRVVEAVRGAREKGLSTIVFLNTIRECNEYKTLLLENGVTVTDIQILDDSEDEENNRPPEKVIIENASDAGMVTLATAAGGRGTDFSGVDVGVVAKPSSQRVTDQQLGRVGRNGQLAVTYRLYCEQDLGYVAPEQEPEETPELGWGAWLWQGLCSCLGLQVEQEEVHGDQPLGQMEALENWQSGHQAGDLARADRHDRLHRFKEAIQARYLTLPDRQTWLAFWKQFFARVDKYWDPEGAEADQVETQWGRFTTSMTIARADLSGDVGELGVGDKTLAGDDQPGDGLEVKPSGGKEADLPPEDPSASAKLTRLAALSGPTAVVTG